MRTFALSIILSILLPVHAIYGQGEDNVWLFGAGLAVDFSSGAPVVKRNSPKNQRTGGPGYYPQLWGIQAGICDPNGKLRFFVHYSNFGTLTDYRTLPKVFDSSGYAMPHGNIDMRLNSRYVNFSPLIVPWPGNPDKYFVFYARDGGLLYSVVNMQLNNGKGDVDTNAKDVLLCGYSTIHEQRLAAVQGCRGIWIITRSSMSNRYNSYLIDKDGIHRNAVTSEGIRRTAYPNNDTQRIYRGLGRIVGSNDGQKIAVATMKGIELYEFEKCSGLLKNPVLLDTTTIHGLAFSPDNTKLYASEVDIGYGLNSYAVPGRVYQYDLNYTTPALITQSKTIIIESPIFKCLAAFCSCTSCCPACYCDTTFGFIGDLRLAPDKKIYMLGNWSPSCYSLPLPVAPFVPVGYTPMTIYNDSDFLYVIHDPDQAGWACHPELNVLNVTADPWNEKTDRWLPLPIALPPPDVDTLPGKTISIAACFRDSFVLGADKNGHCYLWDNSSTEQYRTVFTSGIYTVGYYTESCTYQTDTFVVTFTKVPQPGASGYSCSDKHDGKIRINPAAGDTTLFFYQWFDKAGNSIGTYQADTSFEIQGLQPGNFRLHISTVTGCDTILNIQINELPKPNSSFNADTVVCIHHEAIFNTENAEPFIEWHFGDDVTLKGNRTPAHAYDNTGSYTTKLIVENFEGCRDTFQKQVTVKHLRLQLFSDKEVVTRGETVMLHTAADEHFRMLAWLPERYFAVLQQYRQSVAVDTNLTFQAIGISDAGCLDTAQISVRIHPVVNMPTAFTPNGDGKNDCFRPHVLAGDLSVQRFRIYDRWGKLIWEASGSRASAGWDGTYQGAPAEIGTYFYVIEGKSNTGKDFHHKGDVTLVR